MRPRKRTGIARTLARITLAACVLALVVALVLALETAPRVADTGVPDADTAALTRDLAESLRDLVASEAGAGHWTTSEQAIDAALRSAHRVVPELRGDARITADAAALELSIGPPVVPLGLWLNAGVTLAPSSDGIDVRSARIGRLPLPAAAVVPVARMAGDRLLGDDLVSLALAAVDGVAIHPPEVSLVFSADPNARAALFARIREGVHSATGADDSEPVHVQLWYLTRAGEAGGLPDRGSMLPYLRFVVAKAAELSGSGGAGEQARAALLALALYCGDGNLGPAVGVAARDASGNRCAGTTLGGRDDLKRHFSVSAGIEAARSGTAAALGVGELKELLDSNAGGSGFSFDDMAANLAGVRFARTLLATPAGQWPDLVARIRTEADILPSLEGLPSGLDAASFRAHYGEIDSPAYAALIAEIDRRVDALPLYATPPSN